MAEFTLAGIGKTFGRIEAVRDLDLTIADGELVVLLGPTGAGKTTTLRLIAGLEAPTTGSVLIDGKDVTALAPALRDVTFVFQQYSLYPHLTVYDNLAFPLRSPMRRVPEEEIRRRIGEVAKLLRIDDKLANPATRLSGGQMQRVAIGRALVRQPAICLMDEPLSSLDAKLRGELRVELKHIQRDFGATFLYVTHDQMEAMTMANRIGVLEEGRLVQIGSPRDVYENPASTYVASRLGQPAINLLPRRLFAELAVPPEAATIGIRTEHVRLSRARAAEGGDATATIKRIEHLGDQNYLHLDLAGHELVLLADPAATFDLGETVDIELDAPLIFDANGQRMETSWRSPSISSSPTDPAMSHFFNSRETIVTEALDGVLSTSPPGTLARLDGYPAIKVVMRADWDRSKVAVISGGGSGHEPAHAGFVGSGLLTAAVAGEIFASPSVDAVLAAIRAVTGPAGALLIVKNYTGDRLNFGLAAERARAEGFRVEVIIVADDIAIPSNPQPRGIAGTLLVHKIAGYLSETGADLTGIADAARSAARDTVSIGASLSSCSIPGQPFTERLAAGEGELGLGIHGEPGIERFKVAGSRALVGTMVERLERALPAAGDLLLLINNLGAVPVLEMSLIAGDVLAMPVGRRVKLVVGPAPLMTSLDMNGFSLSLLPLDALREAALTAAVASPAFPRPVRPSRPVVVAMPAPTDGEAAVAASADPDMERSLAAVCRCLVALERDLNHLDARVGDGDTGTTLATGARSILAQLPAMPLANSAATFAAIGKTLATSMGGSSGVLLSVFFTSAGAALKRGRPLADALNDGLERVTFYGGAKTGDRTMIDALAPALAALKEKDITAAAGAARAGALATRMMNKARAGRSSYLDSRDLDGVTDPGAEAVASVFEALASLETTRLPGKQAEPAVTSPVSAFS